MILVYLYILKDAEKFIDADFFSLKSTFISCYLEAWYFWNFCCRSIYFFNALLDRLEDITEQYTTNIYLKIGWNVFSKKDIIIND